MMEVGTDLPIIRIKNVFASLKEAKVQRKRLVRKWTKRTKWAKWGVYGRIFKSRIHRISKPHEKIAMYEISDTETPVDWACQKQK